jgi:hypothetical protein
MRVAAVDHDVARIKERQQFADHRVGRLAGLHHDDDRPRPGQAGHKVGHAVARHELALVAVLVDQAVRALR